MSTGVRRIAVLSLYASPRARLGEGANGGLNVYVREVCRALGEAGISTDVFSRVPEGEPVCVEPLGPGSRLIMIPTGDAGAKRAQLLASASDFAGAMADFATTADGYDVLYSHDWLSGAAAFAVREQLVLPWAHTAHTWAVIKNRRLPPGANPEPESRADVEAQIAESADLLVVFTAEERAALVESYGIEASRAVVVAPGVDLRTFYPKPKESAKASLGRDGRQLFVIAGRLERLKGVDLALRAMSALREDHPNARLLVLGADGGEVGEERRLREIAGELGLKQEVEFLGPASHSMLRSYYSIADACLLPSYTESFGLVGLEAMACGTPLIASRAAGIASLLRDGEEALLVNSGDAEGLATAMGRILDQPKLATELAAKGAQWAAGYSWQDTAADLLHHFRSMARNDHL
jgi:D-inositol-3-phosphate glycosyltransferase